MSPDPLLSTGSWVGSGNETSLQGVVTVEANVTIDIRVTVMYPIYMTKGKTFYW